MLKRDELIIQMTKWADQAAEEETVKFFIGRITQNEEHDKALFKIAFKRGYYQAFGTLSLHGHIKTEG